MLGQSTFRKIHPRPVGTENGNLVNVSTILIDKNILAPVFAAVHGTSIYWIRLTEYTRSISFYFGEKAPGINVELIQKYVANDLQSIGNNFTRAL